MLTQSSQFRTSCVASLVTRSLGGLQLRSELLHCVVCVSQLELHILQLLDSFFPVGFGPALSLLRGSSLAVSVCQFRLVPRPLVGDI